MKKIAILAPGAFGTALGIILSGRNTVSFWYKDKDLSLTINQNRQNTRLPGVEIPKSILISSELTEVIENADLITIASPSFYFRKTCQSLKNFRDLPPILGLAKGVERASLKLPSQIVTEVLGKTNYAHLSGPGFAREIIRGKKAKEVIASKDRDLLRKLKRLFGFKSLEISTSADLIGVQLAGAIKNALAIGISLVEAKESRAKIRKKLIALGLDEMLSTGEAFEAKKETFLGPAGWDDLVLTSTNPLSRNYQFGHQLLSDAQTMREEIRARKITVEGLDNIQAFYKIGKINKLNLPIINETYKVIYKDFPPEAAVDNLVRLVKSAKLPTRQYQALAGEVASSRFVT